MSVLGGETDDGVRSLPAVCRLLRTKTAYGADEAGALWKLGDSTTATYWCLATMEPFGVDDRYCHPHTCTRGRACYEPHPADDDSDEAA